MSRAGLLGLALLALGAAAPAVAQPRPGVGAVAPDTRLPDQHGRDLGLADLLKQRQFVVVAFYVKAFTGG